MIRCCAILSIFLFILGIFLLVSTFTWIPDVESRPAIEKLQEEYKKAPNIDCIIDAASVQAQNSCYYLSYTFEEGTDNQCVSYNHSRPIKTIFDGLENFRNQSKVWSCFDARVLNKRVYFEKPTEQFFISTRESKSSEWTPLLVFMGLTSAVVGLLIACTLSKIQNGPQPQGKVLPPYILSKIQNGPEPQGKVLPP